MDHDGQLRNLRDFLLVYNRMTEICFQRCTSNFNYRNLTMDEERCVDNCAGKLIRTNHRLMGTYVQLMPTMMQRRMQEMENKAAEVAKAEAEAAAQGGASALESTTTVTDPSPVSPSASEFPATSSSVMETPSATADHTLTLGLTKSSTPPELRGSHITSAHNEISEVQAPETVKLSTSSVSNQASLSSVTDNTQTFTTESSGLVTASPVISTPSGSSVPSSKVGVGSVSSAVAAIPVEKLDLKSSNITATPVPETRSTGGAGQNTKTTS